MMTLKQFSIQNIALSLGLLLLLWGLAQVAVLQSSMPLAWASLAFFSLLSSLMFVITQRAAQSAEKYAFINWVILFTIVKMVAAVVLVLVYDRWQQPTDNWFFLPFFGIYLVFTVFETYFMTKLSGQKQQRS